MKYSKELTILLLVVVLTFGLSSCQMFSPGLTASFDYSPSEPAVGEFVQFDASDSDPADDIVSYDWGFGDNGPASGEEVSHSFDDAGTYTVELSVANEDGKSDSTSKEVEVGEPTELTAIFSFTPEEPTVDEEVSFDASDSYTPDGTSIDEYEWKFGDGTTELVNTATTTHTYTESGDFEVQLTVTNYEDEEEVTKTVITVGPELPSPPG